MLTKQKIVLLTLCSVLTIGLFGAILVVALPGSPAYAQSADDCSPDKGITTGPKTEEACKKAIEDGNNPCVAINTALSEDADSTISDNDRRAIRIKCEDNFKGPCSTEVIPEDNPTLRNLCFGAQDNGKEPCDALYESVKANEDEEAGKKIFSTCQKAIGGSNDCASGSDNCCAGVKTSIITGALCQGKDDKEGGGVIFGLLKTVLQILTACIGIAAVGGIGYGALLYTTAENKPEQTKRAIEIIRNVVVGIIAYALMYVLLNFLIPGGVFT